MYRHRPFVVIAVTLILAFIYMIVAEFGSVEDTSTLIIKMSQRVS